MLYFSYSLKMWPLWVFFKLLHTDQINDENRFPTYLFAQKPSPILSRSNQRQRWTRKTSRRCVFIHLTCHWSSSSQLMLNEKHQLSDETGYNLISSTSTLFVGEALIPPQYIICICQCDLVIQVLYKDGWTDLNLICLHIRNDERLTGRCHASAQHKHFTE